MSGAKSLITLLMKYSLVPESHIVRRGVPVDPVVFELIETDGQGVGTKDFFVVHGISPL
jgi:hypothetical protein